jgi:hypothetical protein
MSDKKEPHFFPTDLSAPTKIHRYFRNKKNYLKLFSRAKKEIIVGEASAYYLCSQKTALNIKKFNTEAKILIMFHSPVEVIESLYKANRFSRQERFEHIGTALAVESARKKGYFYPKRLNILKESFWYKEIAKYSAQVERYLKNFSHNQVKIVIFDDFREDPQKVYQETLNFLEVDRSFVPEFKIYNKAVEPKNRYIQSILSDFLVHHI